MSGYREMIRLTNENHSSFVIDAHSLPVSFYGSVDLTENKIKTEIPRLSEELDI